MPGTVDCWQGCVRSVQRTLYTLGSVHSEGGCCLLQCVRPCCTVRVSGMLAENICTEIWFDEGR
jgi:hypothetical protein